MVLVHKESLTNRRISINWQKDIGDWVDPLYSLLESDYIDDLVTFIQQKYLQSEHVYPKKSRLFKPFQYCKYDELKVVMISNNAPISEYASGFGFGINSFDEKALLPNLLESLKILIKESLYPSIKGTIFFDSTLQDYAEQGVLFLNTSLTVEANESHSDIWRNFVRQVIKTISKEKDNIIFVFLNGENELFEKYIDVNKHYILRNAGSTLPHYSNIISKIEDIILCKYGSREHIQW
jgi:uracil-DNA glycosylase